MTAATTPTAASRGDWAAWPLKSPPPAAKQLLPSPAPPPLLLPSPAPPPLELQFLPPSAAAVAAAASASRPAAAASASPWTVDPSRLQKLMMGSPSDRLPATTTSQGSVSDVGPYLEPGASKPLPSGWERCLDLKSGEVFIKKKCEVAAAKTGISQRHGGWQELQAMDMKQHGPRPARLSDSPLQTDDQRTEWTPSWMLGNIGLPTPSTASRGISAFRKVEAKGNSGKQMPSSPDGSPLCLDLDLRLCDNRSRLASEAAEVVPSRSHIPPSPPINGRDGSVLSRLQPWSRHPVAHASERPASIQEMVSESTMATAVCPKCLMYVLLKKSNPTCPRCFNPIILDCGAYTSVYKRPRLEI